MKLFFSRYLLASIILFQLSLAQAQEKYSQVKIYVKHEHIIKLQQAGLYFDHIVYNHENNTLITTLSASELAVLKKLKTKFDIIVDDEAADFLRRNKNRDFYKYANEAGNGQPTGKLAFETNCSSNRLLYTVPTDFTEGAMGGYYTLAEIMAKIDQMKAAYPTLVDTFSLSLPTTQGRKVKVVKISDNAATDETEPEVLYTGLVHAREGNAMMNLLFFMQYMLQNYATDTKVSQLIDSRELFFIPCLNPDGFVQNQTTNPAGGGMQRKNMRDNGGGIFGVDLNRNFPVGFALDNTGSSPTTSSDAYRGPSACSEPESQGYRDFVASRNFQFVINCHAFGNYIINPYATSTIGTLTADETAIYANMPTLLTKYNFYVAGTPLQTVGYNANGTTDDWLIKGTNGCANCGPVRPKVLSYSPEVGVSQPARSGFTSSQASFWPVKDSIIPIAREMAFAHYQTACIAGSYYDVQDTSNIAISNTAGSFSYLVRRWGIGQADVTVSLIPIQNIATVGAPVIVTGTTFTTFNTIQYGSIAYTLSAGIANGTKVQYVWRSISDGITVDDTITKLYNPTVVFSDDMELTGITLAASKWTRTGSWDFSTGAAFRGTRALTESPSGNYAASLDNAATLKTAINLSGSNDVFLTFFTKHAAENGNDRVTVEISTTGVGAGAVWSALCGKLTVAEPKGTIANVPSLTGVRNGWVRELIDLGPYKTQTNIGLRFRFRSNAGTVVGDGFYFDEVKVIKNTAGAFVANAINPAIENANRANYINCWPTTTSSFINVKIKTEKNDVVNIDILTLNGQLIKRTIKTIVSGNNNIQLNVKDLPANIYTIWVRPGQSKAANFKFIKEK